MDIHKPKTWRSVREFLKEYVIIVIGVLTALGAGQIATSLNERKIADEARQSIRAEVSENLWWVERRKLRQTCIHQRLDEIADLLDRARHGRPYPVPRQIGWFFHSKITNLRWQTNAQAGRASLFTPEEQRNLGNMYYTTDEYLRAQNAEDDVWARLHAIEGLDRLTPQEIDEFSSLLAQARAHYSQADLDILRAHQWAERMRLTADNPNALEGTAGPPTCVSISTPPTATVDDTPRR